MVNARTARQIERDLGAAQQQCRAVAVFGKANLAHRHRGPDRRIAQVDGFGHLAVQPLQPGVVDLGAIEQQQELVAAQPIGSARR